MHTAGADRKWLLTCECVPMSTSTQPFYTTTSGTTVNTSARCGRERSIRKASTVRSVKTNASRTVGEIGKVLINAQVIHQIW